MAIAFVSMLVVPSALKVQLASALLTVVDDDARILAAIKGQETSFSVQRE